MKANAVRGYEDAWGNFVPLSGSDAPPAPGGFAQGLAKGFMAGMSKGSRVVVRSQVTPEIAVNLSDAFGPSVEEPVGLGAKAVDWIMESFVRPEVEINLFGQNRRIAPWGHPSRDLFPVVQVLAVGAVGLAAWTAWRAFSR